MSNEHLGFANQSSITILSSDSAVFSDDASGFVVHAMVENRKWVSTRIVLYKGSQIMISSS